jgi:hypothetical protein
MSKLALLDTINESMHLNRLQGATDEKIKNAFFANYLGALVMLRLQDLKGLMLINDQSHSKLTRFSANMSDVNFWGRALFYPTAPEVKNRLAFGHDKILAKEAGRVMDTRIQKMMKVPMTAPDQVDWDDTIGALLLLKHRFGLQSSYFNNITYALHKWSSINDSAKKRAVNQAFMYLMQSDPQSSIISRIRSLSSSTMVTGIADIAQRIIGFTKLKEDGEAAGGAGTSTANVASTGGGNAIIDGRGAGSIGTPSADPNQDMQNILAGLYKLKKKAPYQVTKKGKYIFKDGKIIKKKVQAFHARKFKAPDFLRVKKTQGDK